MSLDESLYNCLIEFTNSENEVREEAERTFQELVNSNKSDDVLTSLLNIIDKNPQSNVSFSALIQLRYYSFAFIANQLLDNEYLNYFRNSILGIYTNPKFPIDMRRYITHMIGIFFIFSLNPVNHSWPEIYDFLDKALHIPELYADIIEFYINFIHLSGSFDYYDEERVQFIFSHLDKECSQKDRSYSAAFFIKYWNKYSSELSSVIDFLSILNELDDKYFRYLAGSLIDGILKETIQLDPQTFYDILFNRIVDDNNDELFRQYCLNNLVYIICQNKSFYQIFSSNLPNFMEMMYITTNDPHTYPILYEESITSLDNMKYSIINSPILHNLLYTMVKNTNPFVSSLFQRYLLIPDFYQNGIFFASQEDPYIRENGIYYLRKLVKFQTKKLYLISNKVLEDIATCLLESYTKFNDLSAIRALSKWCYSVKSETLSIFADSICELCTNIVTFETIECGAKLLHLKEGDDSKENEKDDDFALFLLSNVNKILSSDYQIPPNSTASLKTLVNCLPQITHFVSMKKRIEFMKFLVPIICEDNDALFSKGLTRLFIQLEENVNLFDKQILSSLFLVYSESLNTLDSRSISNFLIAISSYGKFFTIFETEYLQFFMQICLNIINEEKTFTCYSIPDAIKALGKMLSYYEENDELFNALFDFPFHFIYEDDEIDDIKYYLKIIFRLTQSDFFNEERAPFVFDNLKKIFDHCHKSIVKAKEDENSLHFTITFTISSISEILYSIFSSLFKQFPDQTCQIIISNYLEFPSDFPLEMQTTIVSIYFEILSKCNDDFFKEIGVKLIKNLYDLLEMVPSGQEEHLEMIAQLSHDDINVFYGFQKVIFTGFGNLFYQKKENIEAESTDQIIKTILNILPLKNDNDFNRELNDLQDHCISCMSKLIFCFKLNEKKLNEDDVGLITLIFNWLPNIVYIDDLTFDCYFKILIFCISENIFENSEKIDEMTNLLCKCIQEKKVSDRVLRTIYNEYSESNLNEKAHPLLVEIEKFLSVQ